MRSCKLSMTCLAAMISLFGSLAEARQPPSPAKASANVAAEPAAQYHLHLANAPTTRWVSNMLVVQSTGATQVKGQVHLQFGIGPQARMPQGWEKSQMLAFVGSHDPRTSRVDLVVTAVMARGKARFRFRGYRITQGVDGYAGIYFVDGKERGAFLALRSSAKGSP